MSSPASTPPAAKAAESFSRYEIFLIALLSFLSFTVILDFMILSPLGAMLLEKLHITTDQFGKVVSGYAFAAGISGLLAAGFADRFDRKHLLLFFYTGFLVGTLLCALATSYQFLLFARIFTGFFGGVVGAVSMAIIADVFPLHRRGRVMGFTQASFAGAQVLGLPLGLWLANHFGWHAGFLFIVAVGAVVAVVIAIYLKPVDAHLTAGEKRHPAQHLWLTAKHPRYIAGFAATVLLSTGGFMLMPFGSTFSVNNLGLTLAQLPMIYFITGICSMVFGPLLGRLSDKTGRYQMFVVATLCGIALILFYTRLEVTPLWEIILLNVVLFSTISARMISASTLTSGVPKLTDRGAYMAISNSLQQIAGGIGSSLAGHVVYQSATGRLENYPRLGLIVGGTMLLSAIMLYQVHRMVKDHPPAVTPPPAPAEA